ncbi:unnamed protein product [Pleuronectes platessa]|uniref:Uncharacterized protein n=1 Tax=Pleuronectes platessa TaxID=8262 RepID=A0A9N7TP80_PLEPL|nr:unnamed protein product [Pleuronectes platessa]
MTQTDADLWLAAVTQKGREKGGESSCLHKQSEVDGVRDGISSPPLTQGCRDEQLAMNTIPPSLTSFRASAQFPTFLGTHGVQQLPGQHRCCGADCLALASYPGELPVVDTETAGRRCRG